MILNPKFYEVTPVYAAEGRRAMGLDPARPTGLVLFGGMGSEKMAEIFDRIDNSSLDVQLILLCGKNEKLRQKLGARRARIARVVEGFTRDVPRYMQLADFFIGKPGPGSISEAIHMGLPVIVEKNAWTLPQERFNADWVVQNNVGESLGSFREVVPALERLLAPGRLAELQRNARAIQNRAIFEVVDHIASLLPADTR
jgi:1,2-diacylglycerol 3-beta-galactosyltransferase